MAILAASLAFVSDLDNATSELMTAVKFHASSM